MYTFCWRLARFFPLGICRKYMKLSRHHQIKRSEGSTKKKGKITKKMYKKRQMSEKFAKSIAVNIFLDKIQTERDLMEREKKPS